jgi:hypothetical protein
MGRREYAGGYPRRRYGGQSSYSSKSIFHYGWILTRKRGRVMPTYQIIEGEYSYEVEADNYSDALDYVKGYEREGE